MTSYSKDMRIKHNVKCECCDNQPYATYERDYVWNDETDSHEWMWVCNNCRRTQPILSFAAKAEQDPNHMTPSQQKAIARFRSYIESGFSETDREKYGAEITRFETKHAFGGSHWLYVETDYTKLPEGNLLRVLNDDHWVILVGRFGGMKAISYPRCYDQFAGRRRVHHSGVKFERKTS